MTVYTNDPIRVKITLDDIWRITHPKGIDSTFYPASPAEENEDEYFCKLVCSDTNPWNPQEEKYKEDLEKEFEKLKIVQDHIREHEPYRHFNLKKKGKVLETILDEKIFGKENRYDILLDKITQVHMLKNGQLFGVIEDS